MRCNQSIIGVLDNENIIAYNVKFENNFEVDIEADGGINTENANIVREAGADMLVSGSAIINAEDYKEIIIKLKG